MSVDVNHKNLAGFRNAINKLLIFAKALSDNNEQRAYIEKQHTRIRSTYSVDGGETVLLESVPALTDVSEHIKKMDINYFLSFNIAKDDRVKDATLKTILETFQKDFPALPEDHRKQIVYYVRELHDHALEYNATRKTK